MSEVLFLVMRNDLPSLNPGKLAAQAAHCANAFVASAKWRDSRPLKRWQKQSSQSFGTTITLGAHREFIAALPDGQVWDNTYPCEIPHEVGLAIASHGPVIFAGERAFFLRRELIGAFVFSEAGKPQELKDLELYP